MTRNKCYLTEYEDYDGGFVSFGDGKGRISGKGKIKTRTLDFDSVYFCKELKYNLFSVSQICDKKNNVLFTDSECLVLSSDFKLLDESQVLMRVPRKDNIYSVDLNSVVPTKGLTCLIAKATIDESNLWHKRLGHTNFKNMNKHMRGNLVRVDFLGGLRGKFSVARTPQQNGVAERKNRTLIDAARTMLVDSKLPTTFWAEVVNTACYVLNRVLVIKPHNKTPYELIRERPLLIDFMKPFGYLVTILNTRDHLGKFDEKADEGYFVGHSVIRNGPDWLFDVDYLTISINYVPVITGNQTNDIAGTRDNIVTGLAEKKTKPEQEYILIPICTTDLLISQDPKVSQEDAEEKPTEMDESRASDKDGKDDQATRSEFERLLQQEKHTVHTNSTNSINTVSTPVSTAGPSFTNEDPSSPTNVSEAFNAFKEHLFESFFPFKNAFSFPPVSNVTPMNDTGIFGNAYDDNVWTLVDLPHGKKAIGTKWVFRNKKHKRGIVIDVKSTFLYGTIEEEVYVSQPLGFVDPEFLNRVYKVEKALYGLHQAPRAWYETLSTYLLENGFRRGTIDKTLFIKKIKNDILLVEVDQRIDGIFLSQDKYLYDILKKFGLSSIKTASTPMETHKPLLKDADVTDVDVHLYRFMIGSLMYLTSSRQDIMFAVCACSRFQVQPKASHMHAMKRIFRYLKGQPTLGLWYPKDSPLDLIAYSDSDYTGASLDRKSTTGGCQFLGCKLISWQCKKQTIMANSTTEAEYIAASNCYYNVADLLTKAFDVTMFQFLIASIEALLEERLYGSMCIIAVDYTSWILRMEFKYFQVMKIGLNLKRDSKELAIPGQTTTGKEFSNPLMAGSLPKTINLKFVDQHIMVACLEKSDDNSEFHQIVDFLSSCSLNYALTAVVISESSVRSDILLDDKDGINCLTNSEIFENLALMGYEQLSTKLTFQKDEFIIRRGDSVKRATTTDASLDAAQDSDNIFKT
ncbi:putative ribonuclease H-like domain-containing protein [Tanacetum coccineum]